VSRQERLGSQWVPVLVQAALARIGEQRAQAREQRPSAPVESASRAERLARLCEREAGWWSVLGRWSSRQHEVPLVLTRAAFEVAAFKTARAEFWCGIAADWRRRAAGQPVCAVIGCGCGALCGVAA
jgi:hypothetical protein